MSIEGDLFIELKSKLKDIFHELLILIIFTELCFVIMAMEVANPAIILLILVDAILMTGVILLTKNELDRVLYEIEDYSKHGN